MKRISMNREITNQTEKTLTMKTILENEFEYEEAIKIIDQKTAGIAQLEQQIKQLEEAIEKQSWIEEMENIKINLETEKSFNEKLIEGIKPYLDKLYNQGLKKVEYKKKEESYDRLPNDAKDKKYSIKNKILNEVRDELGINDMAHQVMMRLRHESFKEEE